MRRNDDMDVLLLPHRTRAQIANRIPRWAMLICFVYLSIGNFLSGSNADEPNSLPPDSSEAPYIVFVADSSAFARCGPGEDHYRTEPLRRGQELEVYVETGDGWLGIRPPEESFCWMPADAVELSSDGQSATILEDDTVAWIGTHLGEARRYRWQVQLESGEEISVIGSTDRESKSGTKTWLRIVPPSGEFRWIHRDQVAESAEQLAEKVAENRGPSRSPNTDQPIQVAATELPANSEGDAPTLVPIRDAEENKIAQTARIEPADQPEIASENRPSQSTRRGSATDKLRSASGVPSLRPAPRSESAGLTQDASSMTPSQRPQVRDSAFQLHRDADAENYKDKGAVIGSGLRSEWQDDSEEAAQAGLSVDPDAQSVLTADRLGPLPASGAVAAASAIAEPIRKMTSVVANFISPPRFVEIDSHYKDPLADRSAADRRWMVGSARPDQNPRRDGLSTTPSPSMAGLHGSNSRDTIQRDVVPAGAIGSTLDSATASSIAGPSRVVPIAMISRVEDAVQGADLAGVSQILSRLMAEGASAPELDPLIRRIEELLRSGDFNRATRTREVLDLASNYRSVAARRDGATTIASTAAPSASASQPSIQKASFSHTNTNAQTALGIPIPDLRPTASTTQEPLPLPAPHLSLPAPQPINTPLGPVVGTATGYLVQVYSSRPNSPPFALTDDAGLTVAYVTPYPGVNLRNHLNSKIAVRGNEKLLDGMSTPHILVDRAIRR